MDNLVEIDSTTRKIRIFRLYNRSESVCLRKVVRVLALVMFFIRKLIKRERHQESEFINNRVSETVPEVKCKPGQV